MMSIHSGTFVPKVLRLESTYGHGSINSPIGHQTKQVSYKTKMFHDILHKQDGISDSSKLSRVVEGDKATMTTMSAKISSFVGMINTLVAETDSMLDLGHREHGEKFIKRANDWIDLINERLEMVNRCIQAGSAHGHWTGVTDTDSKGYAERAKTALRLAHSYASKRNTCRPSYNRRKRYRQRVQNLELQSVALPVLLVLISMIFVSSITSIAPADGTMRDIILCGLTAVIVVIVLFVSDRIMWED